MTLHIDTQGDGSGCPEDAIADGAPYLPQLLAAVLAQTGVLDASGQLLSCLPLAPEGDTLRWTFNLGATYDRSLIDLPTALTRKGEGYPPPVCDELLAPLCEFYERTLGSPVVRSSGSPSSHSTCDALRSVYGLVNMAESSEAYPAAKASAMFFTDAVSVGEAAATITNWAPAYQGDRTALRLAALGPNSGASVVGRPYAGPDCPGLLEAASDAAPWARPSDATLGSLGDLSLLRFRLYAAPGPGPRSLTGFGLALQVTNTPLGSEVAPEDVVDLVWSCDIQDDPQACSKALNAWGLYSYPSHSLRLYMLARGDACQEGVALSTRTVTFARGGVAPTLDAWAGGVNTTTTVTSVGGSTQACTSKPLSARSRILSIRAFIEGQGIDIFYLDDLYLQGGFPILQPSTHPAAAQAAAKALESIASNAASSLAWRAFGGGAFGFLQYQMDFSLP